ncbi:MAG TPA: heme-binding protein [Candidatus Limnocylindrales bacterium]|nr:heme-binding protein [Candidatus Limnocylindrales bacterium]
MQSSFRCLTALAVVALASVAAEAAQTKPVLNIAQAKAVAAAAVAEARRLGAGGAISIVDDGGHLLYLERLDGTFPSAAIVATEKARSAAIFRKPTADFENAVRGGRNALLGVDVLTPLEGGIPIRIDDQVVGAIGISGAASAAQDAEIARIAAATLR